MLAHFPVENAYVSYLYPLDDHACDEKAMHSHCFPLCVQLFTTRYRNKSEHHHGFH